MTERSEFFVLTIDSADRCGGSCEDCRKSFRVGDVVLVLDKGRGVYVNRMVAWHRRCLGAIVMAAPLERAAVLDEIETICEHIRLVGRTKVEELMA